MNTAIIEIRGHCIDLAGAPRLVREAAQEIKECYDAGQVVAQEVLDILRRWCERGPINNCYGKVQA